MHKQQLGISRIQACQKQVGSPKHSSCPERHAGEAWPGCTLREWWAAVQQQAASIAGLEVQPAHRLRSPVDRAADSGPHSGGTEEGERPRRPHSAARGSGASRRLPAGYLANSQVASSSSSSSAAASQPASSAQSSSSPCRSALSASTASGVLASGAAAR